MESELITNKSGFSRKTEENSVFIEKKISLSCSQINNNSKKAVHFERFSVFFHVLFSKCQQVIYKED